VRRYGSWASSWRLVSCAFSWPFRRPRPLSPQGHPASPYPSRAHRGKLVIARNGDDERQGCHDPGQRFHIDLGRALNKFGFNVAYRTPNCLITLTTNTGSLTTPHCDCGPTGLNPRGAWGYNDPVRAQRCRHAHRATFPRKRANLNKVRKRAFSLELNGGQGRRRANRCARTYRSNRLSGLVRLNGIRGIQAWKARRVCLDFFSSAVSLKKTCSATSDFVFSAGTYHCPLYAAQTRWESGSNSRQIAG